MFVPLVLFIFLTIFVYFQWIYKFSKNPTIPVVFPPRFPLGNLVNPFTFEDHFSEHLKEHYNTSKRLNSKIVKAFCVTRELYIMCDPECVKYVLQSGFENFSDRAINYNEQYDLLSTNLSFVRCPKWNAIRSKITPMYTSLKLKAMFETALECGYQMQQYIENLSKSEVDVLDISISYTINSIASCVFGVECDCFKNPNSDFKKRAKEAFRFQIWRITNLMLLHIFPAFARKMRLVLFNKSLTEFFVGVVRDVFQHRSKHGIRRNDMLQLFIDSQETDENKFTLEDITAQLFVFFAAGFETSSITLTYCLYELAVNTEVQTKLRREVLEVLERHNQTISYDATTEMKYMTQVIEETLRIYPAIPFMPRRCTKACNFPNIDCTLEEDDLVVIPVSGFHFDSNYFPQPERFDPERFSTINKSKIPSNIYMPFGEGPRNCIGQRFATMQLKVALSILIPKYAVSLNKRTITPLRFKAFSLALMPRDKIYLNFEKVKID